MPHFTKATLIEGIELIARIQ